MSDLLDTQVVMTSSITEYFRDSVADALQNQNIEADEYTEFYLVSLLDTYSRTDRFYDQTDDGVTLTPLAELYGEAVNAPTQEQRDTLLRRLGDLALFLSGVFADSGRRRGIDVGYYINMGGSAYNVLSDTGSLSRMYVPMAATFGELARNFIRFVDVLAEVCESGPTASDTDTLKLYDYWQKTGSERARRQLSDVGIVPLDFGTGSPCH